MFPEPLHVGRPNIGDRARLLKRINGALDRLWLSNGPLVEEFEQRIAQLAGVAHCVATCNATLGIQIAARACGIRPGDEVIMPAFTWIATPHALDWMGVIPVFCDVSPETGNADPEQVDRLVGPRTRGILAVHIFGFPCAIDELASVAARHGIPLLFDAAHAIGSTYRGTPIGGFGAVEVFSFHATKYVNSFEGGAIVTDDADIADRARALRNFGIDASHEVASTGTNGKMSEPAAAMGLTSVEDIDRFIDVNRANYERYCAGLAGLPGVRLRPAPVGERVNLQYVVVEIDETVAGVHVGEVHTALHRQNVLSRRYFHPACHHSEPYRSAPQVHAPLPLPVSERLADRALALPTGTAVSGTDVDGVCTIIRGCIARV